MNQIK